MQATIIIQMGEQGALTSAGFFIFQTELVVRQHEIDASRGTTLLFVKAPLPACLPAGPSTSEASQAWGRQMPPSSLKVETA